MRAAGFPAGLMHGGSRPLLPLMTLFVGALWVCGGCGASSTEGDTGGTETPEVWDLVLISDSYGWGVGLEYARRIEASQDVDVRLWDLAVGGLCAVDALATIDSTWQTIVGNAEVLVFAPNGTCSIPIDSIGNPFRSPYACEAIEPAVVEPFGRRLEEGYERVRELRGAAPLLLRTFDAYAPTVDGWRAVGRFAQCSTGVALYNRAIHQAAAAHDVPVAAVQAAFNGTGFTEDPTANGLIGPDGVHTSDSGKALIARLLHDLGYDGPGGP